MSCNQPPFSARSRAPARPPTHLDVRVQVVPAVEERHRGRDVGDGVVGRVRRAVPEHVAHGPVVVPPEAARDHLLQEVHQLLDGTAGRGVGGEHGDHRLEEGGVVRGRGGAFRVKREGAFGRRGANRWSTDQVLIDLAICVVSFWQMQKWNLQLLEKYVC